jgi:hypothetical protein
MLYDGVNVLLRKKLIDIGLVDELLGESAKQIWEKVKGIMEEKTTTSTNPVKHLASLFLFNVTL